MLNLDGSISEHQTPFQFDCQTPVPDMPEISTFPVVSIGYDTVRSALAENLPRMSSRRTLPAPVRSRFLLGSGHHEADRSRDDHEGTASEHRTAS